MSSAAILRRALALVALLVLALLQGAAPATAAKNQDAAPAPSRAELYARGLEDYRAATPDLAGARASWSAALAAAQAAGAGSAERAELCKSLGNVAYRQDRPLEAVAWFTAALELAPRDAGAWRNLELARSKAGLEPADRGDLAATFDRLVHALDAAEAQWLALGMALLTAALLVLRGFVYGRAADRAVLAAGVLALCAAVPCVVRAREARRDPLLVVSTAGAGVASEPRAAATKVALLAAGARVERLEEIAGWTRVRLDRGEEGWVPAETVFALRR